MKPITLTEAAEKRFKEMLSRNSREAIRFGIKGGGCSGFTYYLDFDDISNIDETDELLEQNGVKVIVDGPSLVYILGTTIDWTNSMMGSHFTFNSPSQSSQCGCGHSVNFKV